ncbi:MAG: InlB B-repeat-containing protein [Bacteroidales bacterium]|nr:InlB B-repeat-containing protein [Bacteroidales bacterium]
MKTNKIAKVLTLMLVMITTMSLSVLAGTNKTYYAKTTATASGAGKVYVGTTNAAPADEDYKETSEAASSATSTGNNGSVRFYLHAKPSTATTKFAGWYNDAELTGDAVSTSNPAQINVVSTSTDEANPIVKDYYAKFVEATEFYSSTVTGHIVGVGGSICISLSADGDNFNTADCSASNLKDVEPKCSYYLKAQPVDAEVYRFLGWYSDEACETLISKNANYTYAVTSESLDAENPTQFDVYAKFEAIPYYYSAVNASAEGEGVVFVNTANAQDDEAFDTKSSVLQKVADTGAHTYYLFAKTNDDDYVDFDGWYLDDKFTELLSNSSSYTYKVTTEAMDEESEEVFQVFAKFTKRNMYQVRNAGFEKWHADNEPGFGWNSFPSAVGSQAGLGKGMSPNPEKVEGRDGGSAVRIFSKYAGLFGIGANANGNLTTGIVNMGSMTPADLDNHNFTDISKPAHRLVIEGQPDGVEFYTKYKKGNAEGEYNGHAQFIIHDEYNFRDPEVEEEQEHKIASCGVDIMESEDWARNTGDITYLWEKDAAAATVKYLLINFTTNVIPGGSVDDELIIDDVRLVYNSELASATIGETAVEFVDGAATVDALYDAEALTLTSNGRAATIETAYDSKTGVLTITVKGQDYEADNTNVHVYTIQYKVPTYALKFVVDGAEIKSEELTEGSTINYPEVDPREGYTFAWDNDATEMPADALTITGAYTVNNYTLTFVVDGNTLSTAEVQYGAELAYPEVDPREGYTFAWIDELPATMPADALTITGAYTVNTYKVTYLDTDGETVLASFDVDFGAAMPSAPEYKLPENDERFTYSFLGWDGETFETMPAHDVTFTANVDVADSINAVAISKDAVIYTLNGQRVSSAKRGNVYIINGKKLLVK